MEYQEIPQAQHGKDKGIRGLLQIATQSHDMNPQSKSEEVMIRYFDKFERRMVRHGTPLTRQEIITIQSMIAEIIYA